VPDTEATAKKPTPPPPCRLYPLCHVPLDNILLERLSHHGMAALPCAWSRLDDYECYLAAQHWIRRTFALVPLDAEFVAWMGKPVPRREAE